MIPYNLSLIRKFNAHINVKICNRIRVAKYIYKYIHKGEDHATIVLQQSSQRSMGTNEDGYNVVDEIKQYLDCRYISGLESRWRIFDFRIQNRHHL